MFSPMALLTPYVNFIICLDLGTIVRNPKSFTSSKHIQCSALFVSLYSVLMTCFHIIVPSVLRNELLEVPTHVKFKK